MIGLVDSPTSGQNSKEHCGALRAARFRLSHVPKPCQRNVPQEFSWRASSHNRADVPSETSRSWVRGSSLSTRLRRERGRHSEKTFDLIRCRIVTRRHPNSLLDAQPFQSVLAVGVASATTHRDSSTQVLFGRCVGANPINLKQR